MAEKPQQPAPQGFEPTDIAPRLVGLWAVVVIGVAMAIAAAVYLGWRGLQVVLRPSPASPVEESPLIPPPPRLQSDPAADLAKLLARDRQRLSSLGWVDQKNGLAHIPIDRSMGILADRGWPEQPGQGAPQ